MTQKFKIAFIITKLELGGAQQIVLYLLKHLDRRRFELYLITNNEGILVDEAKSIADVKIYFLPALRREIRPWWDAIAFWQMWRILRREKIDLVHTHSSKAGILGRFAAWLAGRPQIIHTIHGFAFHDYQHPMVRWIYISIEKICARVSHQLVAVAQANIEKGLQEGIGHRDLYRVIRAGIHIGEFADVKIDVAAKKRAIGLAPDAKIVAQIANFKPQKNPLDFVRVAAKVHEMMPDVYFIYIGDGPLRPQVEALVVSLGLQERVKLLGWRHDVPELMQIVDVLLLTSLWEGLPCVYPQAMAAQKPIVGTAVDGGPEAVQFGVNGFLFPPVDVPAMADKVVLLLQDDRLRQQMGAAGRQLVEAFDIDLMVRHHEEMYEALMPTPGR